MIKELRNRITNFTGRPAGRVDLRGINRYFNAELIEARPFFQALSAGDRARFERQIVLPDLRDQDRRTVVLPLSEPVEIEGRRIVNLRLKGICPQQEEDGIVGPYDNGAGYVPVVLRPVHENLLGGWMRKEDRECQPRGTMSWHGLSQETMTALRLGPDRTDLLLGSGLYSNLSYLNNPVGFAVYGMERPADLRADECCRDALLKGWIELCLRYGNKMNQAGSHLRDLHDLGLSHGYPRLGNFSMGRNEEASRILDLDTGSEMNGLSLEQRAVQLYIDLGRVIHSFYEKIELELGGGGKKRFSYMPLLPSFLSGYFKNERDVPFVALLNEVKRGEVGHLEFCAHNLFDFPFDLNGMDNLQIGKKLAESVYLAPLHIAYRDHVDLASYAEGNSFFGGFYEAIQAVAEKLPG